MLSGPLRKLARVAALAAFGAVATAMVAVLVGVPIDATPWQGRLADALTQALGRPVTVTGPTALVVSLRPTLTVDGLRIGNPDGFAGPALLDIRQARLTVALWPLVVRDQVRIDEVVLSDAMLTLETTADGRANWQFGTPPPAVAAPATAAAPARKPLDLAIDRLAVERLALTWHPADGPPRRLDVASLALQAPAAGPLIVALQATTAEGVRCVLDARGGPLRALLAGDPAPWPLRALATFDDVRVAVEGTLQPAVAAPPASTGSRSAQSPATAATGVSADLALHLEAPSLAPLARLALAEPPAAAQVPLQARARIGWQPGRLTLGALDLASGATQLRGDLAVALDGPRPRVSGALEVPVLDLRPFLGDDPQRAPRSLVDTWRELERQALDLHGLRGVDAQVDVRVGQWASLPGDVRDARVTVALDAGHLAAPLQVTAAGVALRGAVDIDAAAETPRVHLALAAAATPLGDLARLLVQAPGVAGRLDTFALDLTAQGRTLGDAARAMALRLSLDGGTLTYGNVAGGRPVDVRLDHFELVVPGNGPVAGHLRGAWLGEAVDAVFTAGDLATLTRELRWPVALTAQASGAELHVDGTVAAPEADTASELRFTLAAGRAGPVARWLGLSPGATAPVLLTALVSGDGRTLHLRDLIFVLGRSRLTGEVRHKGLGTATTLTSVQMAVPQLDEVELRTLMPAAAPSSPTGPSAAAEGAAQRRTTLDIPVLPARIDLSDADIDISLARLMLGNTEVSDVRFEGHLRDGRLADAPFAATLAGTPLKGTASLDLSGAVPSLALQLGASGVDVGGMLARMKVIDGVDARVDTLRLSLAGRGQRLGDLLAAADVRVELGGGHLVLRDPKGTARLTLAVRTGTLTAPPGEQVALAIDAAVDDEPVTIRLSSGRLVDFAADGGDLPLVLSAEGAQTRMDLVGRLTLPVTRGEGFLALTMGGPRLDTLNRIAHAELPAWGPWSIGGRFVAGPDGYAMPDLQVQVGTSTLDGNGALIYPGGRPHVTLALDAATIQLDDVRLFTSATPKPKAAAAPNTAALRQQVREAARTGQGLLTREVLLRQDATLDIKVRQVLSGRDRLGGGTLRLALRDARLAIDPVAVEMPGGAARAELAYEPLANGTDVRLETHVDIDRFDYAVLARRAKPGADLQGRFSVKADFEGVGPLEALMQRGHGTIALGVWPVKLDAETFDLWAVNLFAALLPVIDRAKASTVNCAIGRFNVADGVLREQSLLIDTGRMRVSGAVRVDFRDGTVAARLEPQPKTPQFFNLAIPVDVSGTLDDYKVGVSGGSVVATVGRFLGSVVLTPLRMLGGDRMPADGADVCAPGALKPAAAPVGASGAGAPVPKPAPFPAPVAPPVR